MSRIRTYHYAVRMRKKIVTIGNSAGVTISPADLQELGLGVGDPVEVTVRGGVLELRAVNKYEGMNLDELSAILEKRRNRR
ncbi:Antitoxin component of the MazEF toxin-antitoxin module [Promicromonospora umidemergens]|uniref:SpoVT-AbrB domain-containing protein n=2 Tax=Promicromonospora umidemergens TaxID=629679 RepID=A0ABP8WTP7_9MICO|nr:Antitoxin component of the MazEF toxin-antitoxin module [Promicromonospora umidemergens]